MVGADVKTRLGAIIVTVLAILGAIGGFLATFGYFSYVGASRGFLATCHTLRMAEAKQLITPAQRAEWAKLAIPRGRGEERLVAYFTSDCSRPASQFLFDGATR